MEEAKTILNQHNLSSIEFAADEDDCRIELCNLYVNPLKVDDSSKPYTIATDGHTLIQVDLPLIEDDDLPIGAGNKEKGTYQKLCPEGYSLKRESILLEKSAVRDALKGLKGIIKSVKYLPVLKNVLLFLNGSKAQLVSTDLEVVNRCFSNICTAYPNTEAVKPTEEPQVTILMDAGKLADLAHWFNKFAPDYKGRTLVEIEVRAESSPLVFKAENKDTGQNAYALLMPCRKTN